MEELGPSDEPMVGARRLKSLSVEDHMGPLDSEENVEETLIKSGYVPVDKVLTKDDNGMLMCSYLKAMDATGRGVFVDLDCEGKVDVDPSQMKVSELSDATIVPLSVKMGTYDCAKNDVCGVAFDCGENGICTMSRSDASMEPKEAVFSHTKLSPDFEGHKEHGMLSNHPVSYPIVSMTAIKKYPKRVECSIKDAHDRMRNVAFGQSLHDTKALVDSSKDLHNEVLRHQANHEFIASGLNKSIADLEGHHENYRGSDLADDKKTLRSIHYNLRKRHDMTVDHLRFNEAINSRLERIRELTAEIAVLNDQIERIFKGVDSTLFEEGY